MPSLTKYQKQILKETGYFEKDFVVQKINNTEVFVRNPKVFERIRVVANPTANIAKGTLFLGDATVCKNTTIESSCVIASGATIAEGKTLNKNTFHQRA